MSDTLSDWGFESIPGNLNSAPSGTYNLQSLVLNTPISEADTLQSVTDRGNASSNHIIVSGITLSNTPLSLLDGGTGLNTIGLPNQVLAVNSVGDGLEWKNQSGGGGGSAEWGAINGTLSDQTDLQYALDGKANLVHNHAISDVTNLQITLDGKANLIHNHTISDVTNLQITLDDKATLSTGNIFEMSAVDSQPLTIFRTTAGYGNQSFVQIEAHAGPQLRFRAMNADTTAFIRYNDGNGTIVTDAIWAGNGANLHTLNAGNISTGTVAEARLPNNINATKIANGTVDDTEFQYLNGVTSAIQTQIDGKANTSHVHTTADITSGTLSIVRGGTGLGTIGTSNQILAVNGAGNALEYKDMPSVSWGSIIGAVSDQTDLNNILLGKAETIHTHDASNIVSGVFDISRGGIGLNTLGTQGQILAVNSTETALEWINIPSGGGSDSVSFEFSSYDLSSNSNYEATITLTTNASSIQFVDCYIYKYTPPNSGGGGTLEESMVLQNVPVDPITGGEAIFNYSFYDQRHFLAIISPGIGNTTVASPSMVEIKILPENDLLENAIEIDNSTYPQSYSGNTSWCGDAEPNENNTYHSPYWSIWYKWTAPYTGTFNFSCSDVMAIYIGDTFPLTDVANNDWGNISVVPVNATENQEYKIAVSSSYGGSTWIDIDT